MTNNDDFDLDRPVLTPLIGIGIFILSAAVTVLGWFFFAREMIRIWW